MTHFGSVLHHPSFDTATVKSPDLGLCEPLIFLWPFLWALCVFWTFRHHSSHFQITVIAVCLTKA